jgi:hypothetical protein
MCSNIKWSGGFGKDQGKIDTQMNQEKKYKKNTGKSYN